MVETGGRRRFKLIHDHRPDRAARRWPGHKIPFDGEPADNGEIVQRYSDVLRARDPQARHQRTARGHALTGAAEEFCRRWKNQTEVQLPGKPFLQKDFPHAYGEPWPPSSGAAKASAARTPAPR